MGSFDQVVPVSVVGRIARYVGSGIGILVGPAMVVVLFVVGAFEWQSLLGGVAILLTLGLFSLSSMVSTMCMQRLCRDGRAAIADVVDSRSVSIGEESLEVTLRLSGERIPPRRGNECPDCGPEKVATNGQSKYVSANRDFSIRIVSP